MQCVQNIHGVQSWTCLGVYLLVVLVCVCVCLLCFTTADKLVKKVQYLESNAKVYRGIYVHVHNG